MTIELESPETPPPDSVITDTSTDDKVDSILRYLTLNTILLTSIINDLQAIKEEVDKGTP